MLAMLLGRPTPYKAIEALPAGAQIWNSAEIHLASNSAIFDASHWEAEWEAETDLSTGRRSFGLLSSLSQDRNEDKTHARRVSSDD
ncbi:uncharacterized protein N7459_000594 [Penicillium hispanicum]|uniref:uncharacterized protein n=1 Tax=Penicillium hispanicum TaxID=1080232 RepID=UPI00253FDC19|nr:uncharacterized protein N7459_000594 [Penicillium hispanicum]KAJ5594386.1 hypothetical protein N7459_000594 [Penicillium hispanicum]